MQPTPRILYLLRLSSPAAIAGFVIPVVVDAVNGMLGTRARPHIEKNRSKVLPPAFTTLNASTAVIFPTSGFGGSAPTEHTRPCLIFWRNATFLALSMPETRIAISTCMLQTTTTFSVTVPQERAIDYYLASAIAFTSPHRMALVIRKRTPKDAQLPEALPGKINQYALHNWQGL